VGALVGVGALIAAGTFAVVKITGNESNGGAASPTEVGTSLTTALSNEDVLGVIDLLLPGEREAFREPLVQTFDNLRRLEVVANDASLNKIGGIDIEFTDVSVQENPTNVDDIVNIGLSGSATVTVDGKKVPLGDLLLEEAFGGDRPDMDADPQTNEFQDVPLTVVQRDGRWYLSAFYSAAEQARQNTDADIPDTGVVAHGASAPEGAFDEMLTAFADRDLESIIALLDPTEAEALQRYAPIFLDDAQQAFDDTDLDLTISDTSYTVTGSGSRRFVTLDTMTAEVSFGETSMSLAIADDCATMVIDGKNSEFCTGDTGALDQMLSDAGIDESGSVKDLIDTLRSAFDDYHGSGGAVHQVDGEWYVSPIRTYSTALNDVLDALDANELRDVIAAVQAVSADVLGSFVPFGDMSTGVGGDIFPTDTIPGGTLDTIPGDFPGDFPGETIPDGSFDALSACYASVDAAAGIACTVEGVAAGTIDPTFVSAPILHPECGVAEVYWTADVYSMSDTEFVTMAEGASKCFIELVASGDVDSYLLPNELLAPACLEGKNVYTSSDEAYSNRFYECVGKTRSELGL
jgi:hypothetical protein